MSSNSNVVYRIDCRDCDDPRPDDRCLKERISDTETTLTETRLSLLTHLVFYCHGT